MDALLLGRRIRFYRKEAGLTLDELSAKVDRPTSYLSQLENGHVEARVGLLGELSESLGCTTADLLIDDSPTRRDELEISVIRAQADPRYLELGLAEFKPTAKTSDGALEHISSLYKALVAAEDSAGHRDGDDQRRANVQIRAEMRNRNNYFAEIEEVAASLLSAVDYHGRGPVSERMLVQIADNCGFTIDRVRDLPSSARSVADQRNRVIYIPQRDDLTTRSARSVVLPDSWSLRPRPSRQPMTSSTTSVNGSSRIIWLRQYSRPRPQQSSISAKRKSKKTSRSKTSRSCSTFPMKWPDTA